MINENNMRWNPIDPIKITPKEFELKIVEWLKETGQKLTNIKISHLKHLRGNGGEYEFDAVAEFEIFGGAQITVLIECKRYGRPVERLHLEALWAKLQDVNAQKAIIFSTSGFQSGALQYAQSKNIASVAFVGSEFLYKTKSADVQTLMPSRYNFPKYAGIFMSYNSGIIESNVMDDNHIEPLRVWLSHR
jgi:restriction system protein